MTKIVPLGVGVSRSEAELVAGGHLEGLGGADVALEEGRRALVAGLGGDPIERHAGSGGFGGVSSAQGVAGDSGGLEAGRPARVRSIREMASPEIGS